MVNEETGAYSSIKDSLLVSIDHGFGNASAAVFWNANLC